MKVVRDCVPCYLKQVVNTLNQLEISEYEAQKILNGVLPIIAEANPEGTPAENSTLILQEAYRLMGNSDPFLKAKRESNQLALSILPPLREILKESSDPLYKASQIAIAGNIIDMGILADFDVEATVKEALATDFARNDYPIFKELLNSAKKVLILGDNSGEIAFDKLLVEELLKRGLSVDYVVKEGPILNDATLEDARMVGMDKLAEILTTGTDFLGVVLDRSSQKFHNALREADLVISKGQANYESLESTVEAGTKTFFLLKAKCEVVARNLEVKLGELVFARNDLLKHQ